MFKTSERKSDKKQGIRNYSIFKYERFPIFDGMPPWK